MKINWRNDIGHVYMEGRPRGRQRFWQCKYCGVISTYPPEVRAKRYHLVTRVCYDRQAMIFTGTKSKGGLGWSEPKYWRAAK